MDLSGFCTGAKQIVQVAGWVLLIFRIAIPLIIVVLGAFDLGKAVTSGKDDETKKAAKTLMWRAIAGVFIFFIPSIVIWLFGTIDSYNTAAGTDNNGFQTCSDCILTPWNCN